MRMLEVRGEAPPIVGQVCEELVCQEFRDGGRLEDPANVIHLKFEGRWFRLYFDWGEIVWQPSKSEPENDDTGEQGATYPLVDVAGRFRLKGLRVESLRSQPLAGGTVLTLVFDDGRSLAFRNVDSITTWMAPR